MKIQKLYCAECDKETAHYVKTENILGTSGFSRIVLGILSVGMSELDQYIITTCTECGTEEIYD